MIRLNRNEILIKQLKWREGLIPLSYSKHAKARLVERVDGELIVAPTLLRVTRDNLYNGSIANNNSTRLIEACVRLDYKKDKWMFVALVLGKGIVKSIWIENKFKENDRKKGELRKEVGTISENLVKEVPQIRGFWERIGDAIKKYLLRPFTGKK